MKNFSSFQEFANYLNKGAASPINKAMEVGVHEALIGICVEIKEEVKRKFGVYQTGWKQLADSTQNQRERLGFEPNNPLYMTGDLMDTIDYKVISPTMAVIGSTSPIMVYQELGTKNIPPRPVFSITGYEMKAKVAEMMVKGLKSKLEKV